MEENEDLSSIEIKEINFLSNNESPKRYSEVR